MALVMNSFREEGDALKWIPPSARSHPAQFERWLAWELKRSPGMAPLQAFSCAAEAVRLLAPKVPAADFSTDEQVRLLMRKAYEAKRESGVDIDLETIATPIIGAIKTVGIPAIAAWTARRVGPMLSFIPEPIRAYVFLLVGLALAAFQWWAGIDTEAIALTLGTASAGQIAVARTKMLSLGSPGVKTYLFAGVQAAACIGIIALYFAGGLNPAVTAIVVAVSKGLDLVIDASVTHAAEKAVAAVATKPAEVATLAQAATRAA